MNLTSEEDCTNLPKGQAGESRKAIIPDKNGIYPKQKYWNK